MSYQDYPLSADTTPSDCLRNLNVAKQFNEEADADIVAAIGPDHVKAFTFL